MKQIIIVFLTLLLVSCGRLDMSVVDSVRPMCDKNGGVVTIYVDHIMSKTRKIKQVRCLDGAAYGTFAIQKFREKANFKKVDREIGDN